MPKPDQRVGTEPIAETRTGLERVGDARRRRKMGCDACVPAAGIDRFEAAGGDGTAKKEETSRTRPALRPRRARSASAVPKIAADEVIPGNMSL